MKGLFIKARMKRCEGCKYLFHKGIMFACERSGYYIEPVKYICLKKVRRDKDEGHNEDNKQT